MFQAAIDEAQGIVADGKRICALFRKEVDDIVVNMSKTSDEFFGEVEKKQRSTKRRCKSARKTIEVKEAERLKVVRGIQNAQKGIEQKTQQLAACHAEIEIAHQMKLDLQEAIGGFLSNDEEIERVAVKMQQDFDQTEFLMEKKVQLFEDKAGIQLEFEINTAISLVFTRIPGKDPQGAFVVQLKKQKNGGMKVISEPRIKISKKLMNMAKKNHYRSFLLGIRELFANLEQ